MPISPRPQSGCAVAAFGPRPAQSLRRRDRKSFPTMRPDAGERLPFSLLQPLPFQLRDFFQQALQQLIVLDGLPNTRLPGLRDTGLARLSAVALNQIQGPMEFAFGAMAGGLAALARPLRQSSAKKPAAGNQLRNPGTDLPFGGREGGAGKNIAHLLYANNIQENWQQSSPGVRHKSDDWAVFFFCGPKPSVLIR